MLLQRGHGSILSGFLRVLSCKLLDSFTSSFGLSTSGEGLLESSNSFDGEGSVASSFTDLDSLCNFIIHS